MSSTEIPGESANMFEAFDRELAELAAVEERRRELTRSLGSRAAAAADLRTAGILETAVSFKQLEPYSSSIVTPKATIYEQSQVVAERLAQFESAVADPSTPVLLTNREREYHPADFVFDHLNGEVMYDRQDEKVVAITASLPDRPINLHTIRSAKFASFEDNSPPQWFYGDTLYVGKDAIASLLLAMAADSGHEKLAARRWETVQLHGYLANNGFDITKHSASFADFLSENRETLATYGLAMLGVNTFFAISDEKPGLDITTEPQWIPGVGWRRIWDREKETKHLLAHTIPALQALGLSAQILPIVDAVASGNATISRPSENGHAKADSFQIIGLSINEQHRIKSLRAEVAAMLGASKS